jgi:nucleotide-binding universal stress UspA family protein
MTEAIDTANPVLLCYDGSEGAAAAIAAAGRILGPRKAVVLTVWEPVAVWQPFDPATGLTAPLSKLASRALGLDEIALDLAEERVTHGRELARQAGSEAEARTIGGKPWRAICDVADDIDAAPIVVGARGLSRIQSALLGSVSAAVAQHARRPVLIAPGHPTNPLNESDAAPP